ncbi:MAG: hypothetical protein R3B84_24535 [Zavarzinella sp.]
MTKHKTLLLKNLAKSSQQFKTFTPMESTDPVLHDQTLQGGFIINTEIPVTTLRFNARMQLASLSVLPFALSQEAVDRLRQRGEQEIVELFHARRIELEVFYPADFETTSGSCVKGVVRFTECSSSGEAVGEVIVVSAFKIVPKDISVLSRFGQTIGQLVG